jgi:hypothetical protein
MSQIGKDAKHPDVVEGTPQEKLALAKNTEALRPRQNLYIKIRGYAPIEADKSASVLSAADAFEAALQAADVEVAFDVTVSPPSEATEKHDADRKAKREAAAKKREAEKPGAGAAG